MLGTLGSRSCRHARDGAWAPRRCRSVRCAIADGPLHIVETYLEPTLNGTSRAGAPGSSRDRASGVDPKPRASISRAWALPETRLEAKGKRDF